LEPNCAGIEDVARGLQVEHPKNPLDIELKSIKLKDRKLKTKRREKKVNKRVMSEYIKITSKPKGRLLKLCLIAMDLLEENKSLADKVEPLVDKVEQLTDELEEQFTAIRKEIEQIEQSRVLTEEEEEGYISQITKIVEGAKPKIDELEKLIKELES